MPAIAWPTAVALLLARVATASPLPDTATPYPSLSWVESALITTAKNDFRGRDQAYHAAITWDAERLRANPDGLAVPHLVCAEYGHGREALSRLQAFLTPAAVKPVSHSGDHGACFVATASYEKSAAISADPARFGLHTVGPFPSALKLSRGLLDHGDAAKEKEDAGAGYLSTTHGLSMRMDNVEGLSVELSPGTLPANDEEADSFIQAFLEDLMSDAVDLHAGNVWSDPAMAEGEHLATAEGARRGWEWSRAAAVVHELSEAAGTSAGDICGWDSIRAHHAGDDVLLVSGLDHLLYSGRGAGGHEEEAAELHVACFMGLVSSLAGKPEVFRIAPWQKKRPLNAVARAIIQSASVNSSPLTKAGLDGSGEVIQIVDSGVNETSCYFADADGEGVQHGHYFEEIGSTNQYFFYSSESYSQFKPVFRGGDFTYDSGRRKVIQYISLVKSDAEAGSDGSAYTSDGGEKFPFVPSGEFETDDSYGHGTHVAGTAAGATLNSPAELVVCDDNDVVGCVGGCVSGSYTPPTDAYEDVNLDRLCPMFDCAGLSERQCLSDDVAETLADHGGMAQGAKLAIMDIFFGKYSYGDFAGNGLWESCLGAGCKVHSNSYGMDSRCELSSMELMYDDFMYQNPENLLVFSAGNDGEYTDREVCTSNSPGIAKNVLTVGATSSGETRLTATGADGKPIEDDNGFADINTMAVYSSYGPTEDGRIKPEIVAPGDEIYSAAGDGDDIDDYSCGLVAQTGTSMATAVASGAAAMVRQYFSDSSFYNADVTARGFCGEGGFFCEKKSPSSATVKAMLINSAHLMHESSEPSKFRGFGRIHLEAGMPLAGKGSMALFVADAADTSIAELSSEDFIFDVDVDAGLDLRATLSWIDPASTTVSAVQLINNLDLVVISPGGVEHVMWSSGEADVVNVNERVIVEAADLVGDGSWTVRVNSGSFSTTEQSFSLVVTGAISPVTAELPKNDDIDEVLDESDDDDSDDDSDDDDSDDDDDDSDDDDSDDDDSDDDDSDDDDSDDDESDDDDSDDDDSDDDDSDDDDSDDDDSDDDSDDDDEDISGEAQNYETEDSKASIAGPSSLVAVLFAAAATLAGAWVA